LIISRTHVLVGVTCGSPPILSLIPVGTVPEAAETAFRPAPRSGQRLSMWVIHCTRIAGRVGHRWAAAPAPGCVWVTDRRLLRSGRRVFLTGLSVNLVTTMMVATPVRASQSKVRHRTNPPRECSPRGYQWLSSSAQRGRWPKAGGGGVRSETEREPVTFRRLPCCPAGKHNDQLDRTPCACALSIPTLRCGC